MWQKNGVVRVGAGTGRTGGQFGGRRRKAQHAARQLLLIQQ